MGDQLGFDFQEETQTQGKEGEEKESHLMEDREKQVLECLLLGWLRAEMPLYGGLSYQDVFDLMRKLGVDSSNAETLLEEETKRMNEIVVQMKKEGLL